MPLMKIDLLKGHSEQEIRDILDISYRVMLDTFNAPEGDRYQVVTQHEPYEMQVLDTGLGINRTKNVVIFSLTTRPRAQEQKQAFYAQLVSALQAKLGIAPSDVVINLTVNADEDWSFGFGKAQFLTGDLK